MREPGLRGMILAAGYGTRLAPVSDHVPKPLLPVGGRPLLDLVIDRLLGAGCDRVGINSHHLGGQVATHISTHPAAHRLQHFPEGEILGTGGALDNARDFLDAAPAILVHNGDVLCDVDLAALVAAHRADGALATLLLADWPQVNSVALGADGAVRHIGGTGPTPTLRTGDRWLTYTGVAVLDRALLAEIGPGFSSLVAPLATAVAAGEGRVRGLAPDALCWDDLGTLGRWLRRAGGDAPAPADGTGLGLARITGHGSDRRFWRLSRPDWSAVAMVSPQDDDEFARYLAIGGFLTAQDLGAPAVLAVDEAERAVLLEDLGSDSLYELARRDPLPVTAYEAAVDLIVRLQAATLDARATCPPAVDRALDQAGLRWETAYFTARFLQGHLGLGDGAVAPLAPEFDALAAAAAALPRALIHRDYQSQNLLLDRGRVRPVDFQGLRLGPVAYDLASLLWDPYVDIPAAMRQEWLARFAAATSHGEAEMAAMTVVCALQRVMQALGAYGYLGHVKGRRGFLAHVPGAWERLELLLDELAGLPATAASSAGASVLRLPRLAALVRGTTLPEGLS